jgi:hypothetical protein
MTSDRTAQTCRKSRAARFRQVELARVLKAAQKANMPCSVRIEPNGAIVLIPMSPDAVAASSPVNTWDEP